MASPKPEETTTDYRTQLKEFQSLDLQRGVLFEKLVDELSIAQARLTIVTAERDSDVSILRADLESERESRRGLQSKVQALGERLVELEKARFVLVLIDADADMYIVSFLPPDLQHENFAHPSQFREKYLSRGLLGGQAAADELMEKVREYLLTLGSSVHDAKTVPIVVKAYANLSGLGQACIRERLASRPLDVAQFWIGFTRRYPLVDFMDVGHGKEEADNKIREVLSHNMSNPQCEHILLACCHDDGYVPVLRQYSAQPSFSERLSLLSVGAVRPNMAALGFRTTLILESVFHSNVSPWPPESPISVRSQKTSDPGGDERSSSLTSASAPLDASCSVRFGPIKRNSSGKRIDKVLSVGKDLLQTLKKKDLCHEHYLRSDCLDKSCKRKHNRPKPLSQKEFDALWLIARSGKCFRMRKTGGGNFGIGVKVLQI
ncbi:hypothetical protein G7Y89_g4476 [Cudoniella acicularis]|uniref:DUF7923 domain-containing protein n=1 Tax=Cudoniella acicularis TaxID=354080 RepID=A0A8H4RQT4_9HELO|nr:hypothetical protein G7Y89_g4476 [Cudoniella acicularis]